MFNSIKSFCEIKLENNDFFLGLLALMNILIGPCQVVLDCPGFDEAILVGMNE